MSAWPEPASFQEALVKTVRYCETCGQQTPHEVRRGVGVTTTLCTSCLRRALAHVTDWD
jgi:hypothetical protein